jgi:hypothetical protein
MARDGSSQASFDFGLFAKLLGVATRQRVYMGAYYSSLSKDGNKKQKL